MTAAWKSCPAQASLHTSALRPNADFLPAEVARDGEGYMKSNDKLKTTVPGVLAIGAVRSGFGGMLTDADSKARRAAAVVRATLT